MKTMGKIGLAVALMLMATVARAALDDVVVTFWSLGPDCYADGSPVMEGDIYALVWVRDGFTFAGFQADGTLADPANCIVLFAPTNARTKMYGDKKGGCCLPGTLFQVPNWWHETHRDGRYEVVLLDTRTTGPDGVLRPFCANPGEVLYSHFSCSATGAWVVNPTGSFGYVRGWCSTDISVKVSMGGSPIQACQTRSVQTAPSALPPNVEVPEPQITSFKIEDGKAKLTFTDSSPLLLYSIASGETLDALENDPTVTPVSGSADATAELSLSASAGEGGSRFFKVIRNP